MWCGLIARAVLQQGLISQIGYMSPVHPQCIRSASAATSYLVWPFYTRWKSALWTPHCSSWQPVLPLFVTWLVSRSSETRRQPTNIDERLFASILVSFRDLSLPQSTRMSPRFTCSDLHRFDSDGRPRSTSPRTAATTIIENSPRWPRFEPMQWPSGITWKIIKNHRYCRFLKIGAHSDTITRTTSTPVFR